jgi:hypothetical protein
VLCSGNGESLIESMTASKAIKSLKKNGFIDEKKFINKVGGDSSDLGMISFYTDIKKNKVDVTIL